MNGSSRWLLSILLATTFLFSASPCFAQYEEEQAPALQPEPWVVTGHPVGDTLGRGIDFVLKPVYVGASGLYFFAFKPPEPKHITDIYMTGCPAQPAPAEPTQQPETAPPAQPSAPSGPAAPPASPETTAPPSAPQPSPEAE